MALFKLATKLAPKAIRLIKGGSKSKSYGTLKKRPNGRGGVESAGVTKPKTYGTMKGNPSSFRGVESAGAARKLSKPAAGGMKTYNSLSTAGKVRSTARLFNPMGKKADQRFVGRFGIGMTGGAIAAGYADKKLAGGKNPAPKGYKPKATTPKGTTPSTYKLKATTPKKTNKRRMRKGIKFGS
jgi:hypothetical protein